jgi:hypothetical protein
VIRLSIELGDKFCWHGTKARNRKAWLTKRQDQNYANYSSAQAAFVTASANSTNSSKWELDMFLPHGNVWKWVRDGGLNISAETAIEVLNTMDDVPMACYTSIEGIKDQLALIASLDI